MPVLPIGRSVTARVRALLILVALFAALGAAAALAAAPASAATSEDYFFISSIGPTYGTGGAYSFAGSSPNGICVDANGNIYVTLPVGFAKFTAAGSLLCRYVGQPDWYTPTSGYGIDVDGSGRVYYADSASHRIVKLTSSGGLNGNIYSMVNMYGKGAGLDGAGNLDGEFDFPRDVAVDGNYLYVADKNNDRIQKFEINSGDNTVTWLASWGGFSDPVSIAADHQGHLFIAEQSNHRVQVLTTAGAPVTAFGVSTPTSSPLYFYDLNGIDVDASGNVYTVDTALAGGLTPPSRVSKFRPSGTTYERVSYFGSWGAGDSQFKFPWNLAVAPNGYLYVTDTQNQKIKKFARDATPPEVHATGVWSVWTNDPRHPELIASDPTVTGQYTSGVANIYYSMTGGTGWSTYLEPLWFAVQGDNAVTYYAEDAVGNESTQVTGHVYLDTTKPVTTVSGVPAWSKTDVSVTLTPSADGLSPIAATQYRLQGASTWTTYSGPFTVTAEGTSTYEYRTYDAAANYEAVKTLTVNIDKTAPVTAASGVPAGWSNANVAVTLTPGSDGRSPIASTQYRLQGASAWTTYSAPFAVSAEGSSVYEYRSTDAAGNVEAAKTVTVRIDKTAPVTSVAGVPAGWSNANVAVTLTPGSDGRSPIASTQYRLQGSGTWSAYGAPFSVSAQGLTTYEYRSTDAVGNVEATKTVTVRIDKTGPVTTVSGLTDGWSTSNVAVTLTPGADGLSPISSTQYRLQGASAWTTYTVPFTISAEGAFTYEYRSTDAAGNAESAKTLTVRIDKTAPVTAASGVPVGWSTANVAVTLTPGSDGKSPIASTQYRLQGSATWTTYAGAFTVSSEGASTYDFRSTDGAGNVEATKTVTVHIDRTAPVTTVSGVPAGWSKANFAVTLTPSADGKSPIASTQYRLQGASAWTTYSAPFTVSAEGSSVYEYRSTDGAGNVEAAKTVTVRIDKAAPVTTASGVSTTWSKAPVLVTLTPSGDGPTPVTSTEYRIQGAPTWVTYLGPFTITTQGASVYEYRSTDGAGNVESTKTLTVRVDSVRPVPMAMANKSVRRNAKVKLPYKIVDVPGAQAMVTIKVYKGKAFKKRLTVGTKAANVGLTYSYKCKLPKGKYTWKVYATDLAGNTQAKPGVRTLTVK